MREASAIIGANGHNARAGWWARRSALVAVRKHLDLYFAALRKAAAFAVFERLFALWHVLHLPLFVLLVLTVDRARARRASLLMLAAKERQSAD